ncbi:MAG: 4-hydroxyphenylpyruvate dioxygenase [Myxococcota bacterium]
MESLGIERVEALNYYVKNLERFRRFFTERLGFAEIGRSNKEMDAQGGQMSAVFQAGDVTIVASQPMTETCRAARWFRKHPEGVGTINFHVADIDHAFQTLAKRGGTFIQSAVQSWDTPDGGKISMFSVTTPFGDTTFRFLHRENTALLFPGMERYDMPKGGDNPYGFSHIDHITSNFQTMQPMLLWMEHVMGFRRYWDVEFHTSDVSEQVEHGSGLKSVVMFDEASKIKFANNEPAPPNFVASQINLFGDDHRGDGVQHVALVVDDIIDTVRNLRQQGVEFMPTPGSYYDLLPERLVKLGVNAIDEDIEVLRDLEILVDGDRDHSYLLQIFLKEQAGLFGDKEAGPFFIEIIQRKGDEGFGAGNFRALFESIEREQTSSGRL